MQRVGDAFGESVRKYDYVARMGGDEFVLVLEGMNRTLASERVDGLVKVVEQIGIDVCSEAVVSASIGVAVFPDDGANAEQILGEADRRMYQVKRFRKAGRPREDLSRWDSAIDLAKLSAQGLVEAVEGEPVSPAEVTESKTKPV